MISISLIVVLFLTLLAEFVNGLNDVANAIATVVTTKVLSPKRAVLLASVLNILGTFSGTAVATTIGKGIVAPEMISLKILAAALVSVALWNILAWSYGLPSSSSHALVSGLTGAAFAVGGLKVILWSGWQKVLLGLFFSTFLGFLSAYLIFLFIAKISPKGSISRVRRNFGKLQIFSAGFMAFSHGSNDGQKFIGVFSLALLLAGFFKEFTVPFWVIILCAGTMGLGTLLGGWKTIRTLGVRLTKLEPQHGFAAETGAATVIEIASRFGIPLSTTHTIGTAIMGVGAVQRRSKVKLDVASHILATWILTFPACALISWVITRITLIF